MDKRYVPILWGREGEFGALQTLAPEIRGAIWPLLQVPPVPWDHENDQPDRTIDDHVESLIDKIEGAWEEREAAVDLLWVSEVERLANGLHPLTALFAQARERGLRLVPVTGPERSADYNAAVREVTSIDRRGIVARVQLQDVGDRSQQVIVQFARAVGCDPDDVDLLLDVGHLTSEAATTMTEEVARVISAVAPGPWRSIILGSGAFPENLVNCPRQAISRITREDWRLWRELRCVVNGLAFGDYGIAHPAPSDVDPRIMKASANIRYTLDEDWLVLKARGLAQGFEQFHQLCRALVRRSDFSGVRFSWGDRYIRDCARDMTGPGSLTTWRSVGTSHHISFVVRQIATLLARKDGPVPAGVGR
jgi:hypothetical protein